jgi:hypothetical protein
MSNAQKPTPTPVKPHVQNRVAHYQEALSDESFVSMMSSICGLSVKQKDGTKK